MTPPSSKSRRVPLLLAALVAAVGVRGQQFDGPNLRYPEHAHEPQVLPWVAGVVKEQVAATAAVKEGLGKHGVFLVPNPPRPPRYAAKGTQYGDVGRDKVGGVWLR